MKANDRAWDSFFADYDILSGINEQGSVIVSAEALKKFREPRLMAKLDTTAEIPSVFKQHGINILPIQNGSYILFKDLTNSLYFELGDSEENQPIERFASRFDIDALDTLSTEKLLTSESQAIDFAYISELLHHFLDCSSLHLTIRGRQFCNPFDLQLPNEERIKVSNVQIEVDAGYENQDSVILLEAKIGRRKNFNTRQLLFPYLNWKSLSRKRVRCVFMTYSNSIFSFTEFDTNERIGSMQISQQRSFVIDESPVAVVNFRDVVNSVEKCYEPDSFPFPQADDMDKVVDIISLLNKESLTRGAIADFFAFEERQADYYANAAGYLGFCERNKTNKLFELTELGKIFASTKSRTQRTRLILTQLSARTSFRKLLELLNQRDFQMRALRPEDVSKVLKEESRIGTSESTIVRRSRTVRKWLEWLIKNTKFN